MPDLPQVPDQEPPPAMWELIITGCGTSHGNPAFGLPGDWSTDPRDARRRSGAVLRGPDGQVVLIDVGPDLLHQLRDPLANWDGRSYPVDCITRCDGVLLTHDHADHSHGLNDLRHLNRLMRRAKDPVTSIAIHGHPGHLEELQRMFPYCFGDGSAGPYTLASPALICRELVDGTATTIVGLEVIPFAMSHGLAGRTTGFRCGSLAYLTDLKELPATADAHLQGVEILVLDMLRETLHPTHLNWDEARGIIARLAPRRTVLTHMGTEVIYAEWQARLPPGVEMAVDGWRCRFSPRLPA